MTDIPKVITLPNEVRTEMNFEAQFICAFNGHTDLAECLLIIEAAATPEIFQMMELVKGYVDKQTTNEQFAIELGEYLRNECRLTNFVLTVTTQTNVGMTLRCVFGDRFLL